MDPSHTVKLAKSAVNTGIWPLKESIYGDIFHTFVPKKFRHVEDYLKEQERFSHLFKPKMQDEAVKKIREMVDSYWRISSYSASHQ